MRSAHIVTNNAENWKDEEIQRRTHAAAGGAGKVHYLAESFEYIPSAVRKDCSRGFVKSFLIQG